MLKYNNNIDVVILCGGLGTRLFPVSKGLPKVLVKIGDKPVIDIMIDKISLHGFRRFILCVGHLKEQIIDHLEMRNNIIIRYSEEDVPLGTGGALKRAMNLISSDSFLVVNGDTVSDTDISAFYDFHKKHDGIMSMSLKVTGKCDDYGTVTLRETNRINSFEEKKSGSVNGLVSTGMYFIRRDISHYMPDMPVFSLEKDLFPNILDKECYGFIITDDFIDIGTPERHEYANNLRYW